MTHTTIVSLPFLVSHQNAFTSTPIHVLKQLNALIFNAVAAVEENLLSHQDPILSLDSLESHPIHDRDDVELSKRLKSNSAAAQMVRGLVGFKVSQAQGKMF